MLLCIAVDFKVFGLICDACNRRMDVQSYVVAVGDLRGDIQCNPGKKRRPGDVLSDGIGGGGQTVVGGDVGNKIFILADFDHGFLVVEG